ncbi:MAG: hypothetical protein GJV46_10680 [Geobacter sp.]|nr:hypothetical protein [Geobacter sp.]
MNQNIIHISDIHCGASGKNIQEAEIICGIQQLFSEIGDPECILLVTGDIAFQGDLNSYTIATRFFKTLFGTVPFKRENVLLCPGNHDIIANGQRYFKDFESFAYGVRGDNICSYKSDSVSIVSNNGILFIGINTAYRLDHKYGYVDIAELDRVLRIKNDEKIRVAYFHHHILNINEQDQSVIRNAYELLLLLDKYKFNYLFHGHQHFSQRFPFGSSHMYCFGVRTVSFNGAVTGINTYQILPDRIIYKEFVHLKDNVKYGRLGGYVCTNS